MIIVILVLLGLCLGSFTNALVWRLHKQEAAKTKKAKQKYSIARGRSMCPSCQHQLSAKDLVPVLSWLSLGGKCRYCRAPISWQYPAVELALAALFVLSYLVWPYDWSSKEAILFGFWLVFLTGFMVLAVYDLRWYLLPDKIVFLLIALALVQVFVVSIIYGGGIGVITTAWWGLVVGGGIFYALFELSGGRWIGGGDVKLGIALGLLLGGPINSMLMIFIASLLGTTVALPMMLVGRAKTSSRLPFGPFLLAATIIVYLFGNSLITWYKQKLLANY